MIAAQAETTSGAFVTWNPADLKDLKLKIPVFNPMASLR